MLWAKVEETGVRRRPSDANLRHRSRYLCFRRARLPYDLGSLRHRPDHGSASAVFIPPSHQDRGSCAVDARWVYSGHFYFSDYTKRQALQLG